MEVAEEIHQSLYVRLSREALPLGSHITPGCLEQTPLCRFMSIPVL
jgi:hypothetical protein